MKGVRCSWVDMQKIREALASGARGDQTRLEQMRCVDKATVSRWKAACEVLDAVEGKVAISQLESVQPSHAEAIATAFRQSAGPSAEWTEDTKQAIAEWLGRCETEELTVQQLRQRLAEVRPATNGHADGGCTVDDLRKLIDAGRKFGTVYADPPWRYDMRQEDLTHRGRCPYPTMTTAELATLPLADLAAPDSHLWLWTTNGFLRESFGLIEAWGFDYKSVFVWCKPQIGLGNYLRVSHEFLMFAVRGRVPFRDRNVRSWDVMERGEHSSKPDQVRLMVEKASPGPYLEMFARRANKGWTSWGNQIERDLFHRHLEAL